MPGHHVPAEEAIYNAAPNPRERRERRFSFYRGVSSFTRAFLFERRPRARAATTGHMADPVVRRVFLLLRLGDGVHGHDAREQAPTYRRLRQRLHLEQVHQVA